MRSMDANLTSAVSALTRVPAVRLAIEDKVQHYTLYQSPANSDAWNDACVAPDGSIVRVQLVRGGGGFANNFQYQRVTDPTVAGQWSTWATFSGGSGVMFEDGGCSVAVAADGLTLWAFAQQGTGGNAVYWWTSSNNGASWSGPTTVISPPGGALTKGITSDGNNNCWFLYDVSGGDQVGFCSWNGVSWSGLITSSVTRFASGSGLCAIAAGATTYIVWSDGYSLREATYNGGTWTLLPDVASATSTAIGRFSPRMQYFDNLYQVICTEFDTGALTGITYSYPRVRQSFDLVHWSNGFILHPLTNSYGACLVKDPAPQSGTAGARYYAISMAAIYSAPIYTGSATQLFNADAYVLNYKRVDFGEKASELIVELDNQRGQLNSLVCTTGAGANWQPISLNASLILSEGYKVGSPPTSVDVIQTGTYRIALVEFLRTPQENTIKITARDLSRDLDRECRWQQTYTNQTVAWLVAEVCARGGLTSYSIPTTSNTGQIIGQFVLKAGQTYRAALNELCSTYGLWYFCNESEELLFFELSSSDPSVWSYEPEVESVTFGTLDERANHIIVSGKPPTGGTSFSITEGEAYDDTSMAQVLREVLLHKVDQKLIATSQTTARATSLLAEEQRAQVKHVVSVPVNPGLQVYDVISLTDYSAPKGSGQSGNFHIVQSEVQYDAQKAVYEQVFDLEAQ
jgi:hypothetical protein